MFQRFSRLIVLNFETSKSTLYNSGTYPIQLKLKHLFKISRMMQLAKNWPCPLSPWGSWFQFGFQTVKYVGLEIHPVGSAKCITLRHHSIVNWALIAFSCGKCTLRCLSSVLIFQGQILRQYSCVKSDFFTSLRSLPCNTIVMGQELGQSLIGLY